MPISDAIAERLHVLQGTHGIYELIIRRIYSEILKPGDCAIDGGAHGGMHTIPMAKIVGPAGRVYAIEPIPSICNWLRAKVVDFPQVEVVEAAISDTPGTVSFSLVKDQPWMSGIDERPFVKGDKETIVVQTVTLDHLPNKPVRFIKLDLEGGEYRAIKGSLELLGRDRPVMICEWAGPISAHASEHTVENYFHQVWNAGYNVVDLLGRPFGILEASQSSGNMIEDIVIFPPERQGLPSLLQKATLDALADVDNGAPSIHSEG